MAVRMHVTAIRSDAPAEVRTAFTDILGPAFNDVPIYHHGGWVWFRTSVWGVDGEDLNAGICRLAKPGLQFTTSDGSCWYVVIHGGPQGPVSFLHLFGYFSAPPDPEYYADYEVDSDYDDDEYDPELAFLEDEPEAVTRPAKPFDDVAEDFSGYGIPLPESRCNAWRELDMCEAINQMRAWHFDAVVNAIADAAIPIDAERVRAVLRWENVTRRESDGDLGNLPRLLHALNLGGEWDDYIREAESIPEPDAAAEDTYVPPPPPDHTRDVLPYVENLRLVPIEGAPVALPLRRLNATGLPSAGCSTFASPTMALTVEWPSGYAPPPPSWPERGSEFVYVAQTATGLVMGLLNRVWFREDDLRDGLGDTYLNLLYTPPEGTTLEAAYAVADQPATYQRFRGTVRNGEWWIDATCPGLTSDVLTDALAIAEFEHGEHVTCRSEEEAKAIEAAARRHIMLCSMNVKRKGATVSVDFDHGNLAQLLLRERYPESWDFGTVREHDEKKYTEHRAQEKRMRRATVEMARKRAAPHNDEVILRGQHSLYWSADFLQLDQLDAEPREQFEAAMAALGYTHIGDLVAKKVRDVIVRVFIAPDRLSYAVLMGKRTMYLGYEFVSRLADGSGLTTTTNATSESMPNVGIYYRNYPGIEPEALLEKHRDGLDRFRIHKQTEPVSLAPTLRGVAEEIDRAFGRAAAAAED